MRPSFLCAAALVVSAPSVHADWLLSDYAVVAADSAAVNKLYGIQSFGNAASVTTVTVAQGGYVSLVGTKMASDGTEGYTANIGMLHPLKKDWSAVKLTGITGISFDIRYSVKPTDGVEVGLGSKVIPKSESDAGHSYIAKLSGSLLPAAANTWKTVTLSPADFTPPSWWTPTVGFPTLDDVLAGGVEQIQFAPKTAYSAAGTQNGAACAKCVTPTTTAITLDIRNVTLVGVDVGPGGGILNPTLEGCLEKPVTLDNFIDGNLENERGGYWFAYSDTSSDPLKALDSARGNSNASLVVSEGDAGLQIPGLATATMGLHKKVGGSFDWRPYAGWAAIGTDFGAGSKKDLPKLTGISFQLRAQHLGPQVKGIRFKVALDGVDPSVTHSVMVPAGMIDPTNASFATTICVRPSDLLQPGWYANATAFSPIGMGQLSWEAAINDQINANLFDDSAAFTLTNVVLYGDSSLASGVTKRLPRQSFQATYRDGMLSVQRITGYDHVSVISAQGRLVGRLDAGSNALPVALDRGTYFVVARNAQGQSLTRSLAVLR